MKETKYIVTTRQINGEVKSTLSHIFADKEIAEMIRKKIMHDICDMLEDDCDEFSDDMWEAFMV